MQHKIRYRPSFSLLGVKLAAGEQVLVESGSMVSMSHDMNIDTKLSATGGILKAVIIAVARKILGGESMFINIFTAGEKGGEILIAPAVSGDIIHFPMKNGKLLIQGSSFLAADPKITVGLKFGGIRSLIGGEGLVLLKAEGTGDLFINSYGGIKEVDVDGGFVVDTGHMVAFEETLTFKVKKVGGWKSTLLSGEGLVMEFSGKGKLYLQTRNMAALASWMTPMLHG